ncbi:hypothetical protein [Streptomyces niveus]|jgi:hypothetical protein|uniref:hypothetical protein n=1 Tax=Streptomyces niveus TaxID=193462 RepID=UPI00386B2D40
MPKARKIELADLLGATSRARETDRRARFDKRIAAERNPAQRVAWRTIRDREAS